MAITGTTAQQFWGLGSGMSNIPDIIDAILSQDNLKVTNYQNNVTTLTDKKNAWDDVNSSIQDISNIISNLSGFNKTNFTAATSGDTSYLNATADSSATDMNYDIQITDLAKAQIIGSTKQSDINTALNLSGSFDINGVTITLDNTDTLSSLMNKINNATDGSGNSINVRSYIIDGELFIQSKNTGLSNTISLNDTNGILKSLGLINSSTGLVNTVQDAQNAKFTINNVSVERESNTVTDAIKGVTLNLLKQTSGSISLTVGPDSAKVKTLVNNFINDINALFTKLSKYSAYDSTTNTAALLNGDSSIGSIKSSIINVLQDKFTGAGQFNYLFQIGISIDRYGKYSVDDTKLTDAISKDNGVTDIISMLTNGLENVSSPSGNTYGFFVNLKNALNPISSGTTNMISDKKSFYDSEIKDYNDLITRQKDYVEKRKAELEKEFSAMEQAMSTMNGQYSYITALNNASNSLSSSKS